MAYCKFCDVSIPDEAPFCNTYCDFCGRLLKPACQDNRDQFAAQQKQLDEMKQRVDMMAQDSVPPPVVSGGRYRSKDDDESPITQIIVFLVIAAAVWYFVGDTAAIVVLVIGAIYILRHIIKMLIMFAVAGVGYVIAAQCGISGIWGAIAGFVLAAWVLGQMFDD